MDIEIDAFDEQAGARARLGVGRYDSRRYAEGLDVKAVTYHAAYFGRDERGFVARVVFDI